MASRSRGSIGSYHSILATAILTAFLALAASAVRAGEDRSCPAGFFAARQILLDGWDPWMVRDLDRDGRADIVIFSARIRVLLLAPGRTFRTVLDLPGLQDGVGAVGDFDGDGIPDLAYSLDVGSSPDCAASVESLAIARGTGAGGRWDEGFRAPEPVKLPGKPATLLPCDLNRDGAEDLFAVLNCVEQGPSSGIWRYRYFILISRGPGGGFLPAIDLGIGYDQENPQLRGMGAGDLDGDGIGDIVLWWPSRIDVYYGSIVNGEYKPGKRGEIGGGFAATELAVRDANGDGLDDVVLVSDGTSLYDPSHPDAPVAFQPIIASFLGGADRKLTKYEGPYPLISTTRTQVGDFDGDGTPDLATLNSPGLGFYLGKPGASTFSLAAPIYYGGVWPWRMEAADLDGDGRPDFVLQDEEGLQVIFDDAPEAGQAPRLEAAEVIPAGVPPMTLISRDFDRDGRMDIAFSIPEIWRYDPAQGEAALVPPHYAILFGKEPSSGTTFRGPVEYEFDEPPYKLLPADFCIPPATYDTPHPGASDPGLCDVDYYTMIWQEADINADGVPDRIGVENSSICGTCRHTFDVKVSLGRAPGDPPVEGEDAPVDLALPAGDGLKGFTIADFDGDGALDLAVGAYHAQTIAILRGRPPCLGAVTFLRGDANRDWTIDLTDVISSLFYQFVGDTVRCPAALDVDGDGKLDLSDPVALLTFLYGGGAPPSAPYPLPGRALASDPLLCPGA